MGDSPRTLSSCRSTPISEVARDYKISRFWVHQLLRRFEFKGEAALPAADQTAALELPLGACQGRDSGEQPRKRLKGAGTPVLPEIPDERWLGPARRTSSRARA